MDKETVNHLPHQRLLYYNERCYIINGKRMERGSAMDNNKIIEKNRSYWNDNADFWFGTTALPVHDSEIVLCNRKISTYVNALAQAGFFIEQMIEQTDGITMESTEDTSDKTRKAKMLPISVCFKARKL